MVEVSVSDGQALDNTSFTLTVNPVNDAPVLDAITDQEIDEDNTFTYSLSADDVENDVLTYTASVDGNGSVSIDGSELTIIPDTNFNGDILVEVSVSDGQLLDNTSFTLTVNPINDAPEIISEISVSTDEDNSIEIILDGIDIDGDVLTYLIDEESLNGEVVIIDNIATFSPDLNYNGITSFSYKAFDGELVSNSSAVEIIVTPVNDAPVLDVIADQEVDEDNTFT